MPKNTGFSRFTGLLILILTLAACGGDPAPLGIVGRSGATITASDNHASLVVPANALSTPINVNLTPVSSGFTSDPQLIFGSVYKLESPETTLEIPAELSITVPTQALSKLLGGGPGPTGHLSIPLDCASDLSGCWFVDTLGTGCNPAEKNLVNGAIKEYPVLLGYDSNYSSTNPKQPFHGAASYCAVSIPPVPQIVSLSGAIKGLVTTFNPVTNVAKTNLGAIKTGFFGVLYDKTPPTLKLTSSITPVVAGNARITLHVEASDNVGVVKVTLERLLGIQLVPTFNVTKSPITEFTTAPYQWQSLTLAASEIYGKVFVACAIDAANNKACTFIAPLEGMPSLANFNATPASLPSGGGSVNLTWNAANASTLIIDNGVGDVTGLNSKTVNVNSTTTFTLTASNANGGSTATTTVTVSPPAPTISSFTVTPDALAAGSGSVTLNWASTGASSLSLDNGVGDVTGLTSKVVNVTANTAFTLTATNATGSTTSQASVTVATSSDRFVDETNGLDANICSSALPCKTIAKAMTGIPSGATVYLADGIFSYNVQLDVTIPDGVTLRAIHPGAAIIQGRNVNATGSATINGVVLGMKPSPYIACASLSASASTGTPTLTLVGVQLSECGNIAIAGTVKAVMSPGILVSGAYTANLNGYITLIQLSGTAELLIQGGTIDGNNTGQPSYGGGLLIIQGSSKLTLDAVTVKNFKAQALVLANSSNIVLQNNTLIDHVGGTGDCVASAAIVIGGAGNFSMDHSVLSNTPSVGICVAAFLTNPKLNFVQSTITKTAGAAISSASGFIGTAATITADGLSLLNNVYGIHWVGTASSGFDLKNLTVTGSTQSGVVLWGASSFKLRGSNLSNNAIHGLEMHETVAADLGTTASPGGNTFTGNASSNIASRVSSAITVNAVGNTWLASEQNADANGHYTASNIPGPVSGKNFLLEFASTLHL